MTWPTHALFGISTLWLLSPLPPQVLQADFGVLAAAAAFGALLPDLDASESKIKHLKIPNTQIKPFMLPALVVSRSDQHRGLLHSLAGVGMMVVFSAPIIGWVGWSPVVALLLGYISHLIADSATKSGIRWLYPSPERFYLLPVGWRFTTGSLAEEVLMAPLAVSVICLLMANTRFDILLS
jgi:inner membrane protein